MKKGYIKLIIFTFALLLVSAGIVISQEWGERGRRIGPAKLNPGEKFMLIHHSSFVQQPQSTQLAKGLFLTVTGSPFVQYGNALSAVEPASRINSQAA